MRWQPKLVGIFPALAFFAATVVACGGETVISGIGNSGNRIGATALLEELAAELASYEQTPDVSDADLRQAFAAVREHALGGDPESAFLLLRVAAYQREARDQE